ncbi:hypothetical protein V5N11_005717 [Cardamine amara subsp. amara]|uniref:Endonuclease/exonuclease/phosphatase domain-containing protein n=1 Tax=Cardamine amara subsp. amara TaxID=228776 RepID=A0ABD1B5B5_CARAN
MGDFNQVLHPNKHSNVVSSTVDRRTREFCECLLESELADLTFKGNTFTWWNKRKSNPVSKKLDRALVNDLWYNLFPSSYVIFGPPDFLDHASCGIVQSSLVTRQNRPFKISKKLQSLKRLIRDFSKSNFSDIEKGGGST